MRLMPEYLPSFLKNFESYAASLQTTQFSFIWDLLINLQKIDTSFWSSSAKQENASAYYDFFSLPFYEGDDPYKVLFSVLKSEQYIFTSSGYLLSSYINGYNAGLFLRYFDSSKNEYGIINYEDIESSYEDYLVKYKDTWLTKDWGPFTKGSEEFWDSGKRWDTEVYYDKKIPLILSPERIVCVSPLMPQVLSDYLYKVQNERSVPVNSKLHWGYLYIAGQAEALPKITINELNPQIREFSRLVVKRGNIEIQLIPFTTNPLSYLVKNKIEDIILGDYKGGLKTYSFKLPENATEIVVQTPSGNLFNIAAGQNLILAEKEVLSLSESKTLTLWCGAIENEIIQNININSGESIAYVGYPNIYLTATTLSSNYIEYFKEGYVYRTFKTEVIREGVSYQDSKGERVFLYNTKTGNLEFKEDIADRCNLYYTSLHSGQERGLFKISYKYKEPIESLTLLDYSGTEIYGIITGENIGVDARELFIISKGKAPPVITPSDRVIAAGLLGDCLLGEGLLGTTGEKDAKVK